MIRKALSSFIRLGASRSNLLATQTFKFSTQARNYTPSNKKYIEPWELERKEYVELTLAIQSAYSCKMLGEILKDNLQMLTDYQLSYAMFQLWNFEIEIDSHFYNVISPILKEYIKKFDRECNKSFAEIATFLGRMKVQDDGLWQLISDKLIKERFYRYIPLNDLIDLAHALAYANRASPELLNIVENVIIKHRLRLNVDKTRVALDLFTSVKKGSPLLLQVLANPQAPASELTGLTEHEQLKISG